MRIKRHCRDKYRRAYDLGESKSHAREKGKGYSYLFILLTSGVTINVPYRDRGVQLFLARVSRGAQPGRA